MTEKPYTHLYHLDAYHTFYIEYESVDVLAKKKLSAPHLHNTGEFLLVEKGKSTVMIEETLYQVSGSYLIYYPTSRVHQQINSNEQPYSRYLLAIQENQLSVPMPMLSNGFVLSLTEQELEHLCIPLELLYRYFGTGGVENTEIMKQRCRLLMQLFLAEVQAVLVKEPVAPLTAENGYIGEVCTWIDKHLCEDISLSALAEHFYICKAKLTRDFRKAVGVSIGEYITILRLCKAKLLLTEGMGVAETAQACRFANSTGFIRFFRQHTGETPARYRRMHSQDKEGKLP